MRFFVLVGKMAAGKEFFIHETVIVDENVSIGKDTKIWCFSHILRNASIGEGCNIGQNCMIGANVRIGSGVKIQNNVSVYESVKIEDDVFLGPSMVFTNVINPRAFIERKHEFRKTLVKKGASIGANATVVCGVTIGKYSFIGAGSVVSKDVPDFALAYGVPARIHGWISKNGYKLEFDGNGEATDSSDGSRYLLKNGKVSMISDNLEEK